MPPWRCLPSFGSNVVDDVGSLGLKGGALRWCWASCLGKGLAGGVHLAPLLFVFLVLALLDCLVASASLLCPAKCGRIRGSDCPCTGKGVQSRAPTSVHRQDVGENNTYGITRIPTVVSGRGVVERAGLRASTQVVYPGSGREDRVIP